VLLNGGIDTIPVTEDFAGTLDLEILFGKFSGFIIVETVRVFLPGEDL